MEKIKNLPLTQENFAESISKMLDVLTESKFSSTEINLTNLLVEETFFSLEDGVTNKNSPVQMSIYKRLGETRIYLRLKGNQYNPLNVNLEESDDEISSARFAILNANNDKISYSYRNGENIIAIVAQKISKKKKKLIYTILAMIFGILTGFLMQKFLPNETIISIDLMTDMIRKIFFTVAEYVSRARNICFDTIRAFTNVRHKRRMANWKPTCHSYNFNDVGNEFFQYD